MMSPMHLLRAWLGVLLFATVALCADDCLSQRRAIVFGDSLSSLDPSSMSLSPNRRTDGPVWSEDIFSTSSLLSYATPGAVANMTYQRSADQIPECEQTNDNLQQQVTSFLGSSHLPIQATDCFAIWIGVNDLKSVIAAAQEMTFNATMVYSDVAHPILNAIGTLAGQGGKCFWVFNQPMLSVYPAFQASNGINGNEQRDLDAFTTGYNEYLSMMVNAFKASGAVSVGVNISVIDSNAAFMAARDAATGVARSSVTCVKDEKIELGSCPSGTYDCGQRFWFDDYHFAREGHQLFAQQISPMLASTLGCPEMSMMPMASAGEMSMMPMASAGEMSMMPMASAGEMSMMPMASAGEMSMMPMASAGEMSMMPMASAEASDGPVVVPVPVSDGMSMMPMDSPSPVMVPTDSPSPPVMVPTDSPSPPVMVPTDSPSPPVMVPTDSPSPPVMVPMASPSPPEMSMMPMDSPSPEMVTMDSPSPPASIVADSPSPSSLASPSVLSFEALSSMVRDMYGHENVGTVDSISGMEPEQRYMLSQKINETKVFAGDNITLAYVDVSSTRADEDIALPVPGTGVTNQITIDDWGQNVSKAVLSALPATTDSYAAAGLVPPTMASNEELLMVLLVDRMDAMGNIVHNSPFKFKVKRAANNINLMLYSHNCDGSCKNVTAVPLEANVTMTDDEFIVVVAHTSAVSAVANNTDTSTDGSNEALYGLLALLIIPVALLAGLAWFLYRHRAPKEEPYVTTPPDATAQVQYQTPVQYQYPVLSPYELIDLEAPQPADYFGNIALPSPVATPGNGTMGVGSPAEVNSAGSILSPQNAQGSMARSFREAQIQYPVYPPTPAAQSRGTPKSPTSQDNIPEPEGSPF